MIYEKCGFLLLVFCRKIEGRKFLGIRTLLDTFLALSHCSAQLVLRKYFIQASEKTFSNKSEVFLFKTLQTPSSKSPQGKVLKIALFSSFSVNNLQQKVNETKLTNAFNKEPLKMKFSVLFNYTFTIFFVRKLLHSAVKSNLINTKAHNERHSR